MTSSKRIGFRVDGSSDLGLGHVMRCLALADSLNSWKSSFWIKENSTVRSLLEGRSVRYLSSDIDKAVEHDLLAQEMKFVSIDFFVVDFLRYPEGYLDAFKKKGFFLITFHEFERECPFSDMVINYNSFQDFESVKEGGRECLGPKYVILREGIRRYQRREPANDMSKVLVSMGGSDPNGISFEVLSALAGLKENLRIVLHIGPAFKHRKRFNELAAFPKVIIVDNVTELADLMIEADLAIAAGGNTMYELCYLGVPSLIIAQNDHQLEFAKGLAKVGAVKSLGLHSQVSKGEIVDAVRNFLGDYGLRKKMSKRGREIVDGKGCERIVKKIMNAVGPI